MTRPAIVLCCLFMLALILRLLYIYDISDMVFFRHLVVDQASYDKWAQEIASGDWLGSEVFYQDPLYPYFLAVVYSIFGRNLPLLYVVQSLFSSACVFAFYGMGKRAFAGGRDNSGLSTGLLTGYLAAFLWATYEMSFFYDAQVLKTSPGIALTILFLWGFFYLSQSRGGPSFFLVGLISGLMFTFRGNFMVVVPVMFLWLAFVVGRDRGVKSAPLLLLFVLGTAVVPCLTTVRNYAISGEFVITTAQGGVNFYVGNYRENKWGVGRDPDFARRIPLHEEQDFAEEAKLRTGREMSASELDRFWYAEGLREIKKDPGLFVKRLFRKMYLMINRYEVPDNLNYYFIKDYYSFMQKLAFPTFWFAISFGAAGAVLSLRRRRGGLLILFILSYAASLLMFYIVSRYRFPLVPPLLVFASFGIVSAGRACKNRERKTLIIWLGALLVAGAISCPRVMTYGYDNSFHKVGHAYLEKGKFAKALKSYERALSINPEMGHTWLQYGSALFEQKRYEEALYAFKQAARFEEHYPPGDYLMGGSYEQKGMLKKAREHYKLALQEEPGNEEAKAGLKRLDRLIKAE